MARVNWRIFWECSGIKQGGRAMMMAGTIPENSSYVEFNDQVHNSREYNNNIIIIFHNRCMPRPISHWIHVFKMGGHFINPETHNKYQVHEFVYQIQ